MVMDSWMTELEMKWMMNDWTSYTRECGMTDKAIYSDEGMKDDIDTL